MPTRLVSYIVTANVPALYLALHHDQALYYRAEDSDLVEATLYGGAPNLICPYPVHCAAQESLSRGMRAWRALLSSGKPEDCAHEKETHRKSLNLSHLIDKQLDPSLARWTRANPEPTGSTVGTKCRVFQQLPALAILSSSTAQGFNPSQLLQPRQCFQAKYRGDLRKSSTVL